jgi:hypothetical protein
MTNALRPILLWLGIAGAMLFGASFIASILDPHFVGQAAKAAIRYHVETKIAERVDALDSTFLGGKATQLIAGNDDKLKALRAFMASGEIGKLLASMGDLSCDCRKLVETIITTFSLSEIASLEAAKENLTQLVRTKYLQTEANLTREFRIFTGSNAVVFLLLAIAAFFKRKAGIHLIPAAIILLVATLVTAGFYLFNQNWFYTVLFNDYVGYGYDAYLALVFALLADILLNRGRVVTHFLNAIGNVAGGLFSVVPC